MTTVQTRNWRKSWSKKTSDKALVEDYYNMQKLFDKNSWSTYPGYMAILDSHVELLKKLTDEEKSLYLDLTSRFLWIRDYTEIIIEQLNLILSQFKSYKTIYAMRCIQEDDQKWSKSANVVLYEIKNPEVRKQLIRPIEIIDTIGDIKDVKDIESSLFILVDDFVGTGRSAEKCLNSLKKKAPKVLGRCVIMCIAALQEGKTALLAQKVHVFCKYTFNKGISDYYTGYNLTKNTKIMKDMEIRLHIDKEYSFGYKGSEALICLKHCPNNTFPIYWHGRKSPYPRY